MEVEALIILRVSVATQCSLMKIDLISGYKYLGVNNNGRSVIGKSAGLYE